MSHIPFATTADFLGDESTGASLAAARSAAAVAALVKAVSHTVWHATAPFGADTGINFQIEVEQTYSRIPSVRVPTWARGM